MQLNCELNKLKGSKNKILRLFKFKVPKQPYKIEEPNKKMADIKDPEIKYFNPDSIENDESFLEEEST